MKKIITIMGILSLLGCNKNKKIYLGDSNFNNEEKLMKISYTKAYEIYLKNFHKNFNVKEEPFNKDTFYKVIYMIIFII
ncbi:hypothetical protein [Chryseobacterium sp. JUb7]|uniref:hypothetical protein n=1 Tax=Chryseobacterium sp. JUb7 TaxID=2940599 RepID=UPI002168FEB7|nr:hypothetical protein [Chryseobacterium sp. JUb7]MCS3532768.1 hypothetical protein [Chryseobacterium sp. JUb7]